MSDLPQRLLRHCAGVDVSGKLNVHRCLLLSGLSGSGKSTVGSSLAESLGWIFVDGDDFFLPVKPRVQLSTGDTVSNWDDPASIDWQELNIVLRQKLAQGNVIFVTFLPIIENYDFVVDHHIRLSTGSDYLNKCIAARVISKKITDETRVRRDTLVVTELVVPMYLKICERDVDDIIEVYSKNEHRDLFDLVSQIKESFEQRLTKSYFVCASCLGAGSSCVACTGRIPELITKMRYHSKYIRGQPFLRIDEFVRKVDHKHDETLMFPITVIMYLCAKCRGEKRNHIGTGCRACNIREPDLIVKLKWSASTDTYEYTAPFVRTFEGVSMR